MSRPLSTANSSAVRAPGCEHLGERGELSDDVGLVARRAARGTLDEVGHGGGELGAELDARAARLEDVLRRRRHDHDEALLLALLRGPCEQPERRNACCGDA